MNVEKLFKSLMVQANQLAELADKAQSVRNEEEYHAAIVAIGSKAERLSSRAYANNIPLDLEFQNDHDNAQ